MSPIEDIGNELDTVAPPPVIVDPIEDMGTGGEPIPASLPPPPQQPQPPQQLQQRQQYNPFQFLNQQFQSYMRPPQYSPFGYGSRSMYGLGSYGMPMMGGYGMMPMMGYGGYGGYGGGYGMPFGGGGLMSLFGAYR